MRTMAQLEDISARAKTGYCVLEQTLPGIRMREMMLNQDNTLSKLFRCSLLINALDFGLSVRDKNMAADQLVREGIVAKAAMNTAYIQDGYVDSDYLQ